MMAVAPAVHPNSVAALPRAACGNEVSPRMSQSPSRSRRRRLSLSLRLSLLVLCAALLPLAAVVGFTNSQARDKLIAQSQRSLSTDAAGKNQLIYNYMKERLLDGGALATLPTAQDYL